MVVCANCSPLPPTMTSSQEKRHRSIFELPSVYFNSSRLLPSPYSSLSNHHNETLQPPSNHHVDDIQNAVVSGPRLTCNICKAQFDSLQDQRSHFKSDIHRFNVRFNQPFSIFTIYNSLFQYLFIQLSNFTFAVNVLFSVF
jgi:hypothetical protein